MAPWLRFVEAWAVQQLLRTPAFHRAVEKVARQVHRVRHGTPPDELGGTKIDQPGSSGYLQHFMDEVKTQIGSAESKNAGGNTGLNIDGRVMADQGTTARVNAEAEKVIDESAEAAWRDSQRNAASQTPRQSILGEFGSAIREQWKSDKRG